MSEVYIYGLTDPRDDEIHYLGKANDPAGRLASHLSCNRDTRQVVQWLSELRALGLVPGLEILEITTKIDWPEAEKRWIANGLRQNWPLANMTCGGEGFQEGQRLETVRKAYSDFLGIEVPPDIDVICRAATAGLEYFTEWLAAGQYDPAAAIRDMRAAVRG